MEEVVAWLLVNPARVMVGVSLAFTLIILRAEHGGRRSGGSGWLTLARVGIGSIFSIVTAIVAAFFGGIAAFFGYLLLQIIVCVVMPLVLLDRI
jgi:hypothetical protein